MEKRFVVFIILTMAIIMGYNAILMKFGPKKLPPQAKEAADKAKAADKEEDQANQAKGEKETAVAEKPAARSKDAATAESPQGNPRRVIALGSYQPNNVSPLLVTVNSRGAALERVELVHRTEDGGLRYRDLDDSGGYLGNLSLAAEAPAGCRVQVVPHGTPAAEAKLATGSGEQGIQIGDVILSINDKKVATPRDYDAVLAEMKPGDEVRITVDRMFESQTKTIQLTAKLGVRPFQLIRPEKLEEGEIRPHPLSMLLSVKSASPESDRFASLLDHVDWQVEMLDGEAPGVEFRYAMDAAQAADVGLAGPVELIKRFRLGRPETVVAPELVAGTVPPYHIDFEVEIRNLDDEAQKLVYQLDGTNGLPTEGWWYLAKIHRVLFRGAGARDIFLQTDALRLVGCPAIFAQAKDEKSPNFALFGQGESPEKRTVTFIGVDTQYFAAALLPHGVKPNQPPTFARAEAMVLGDVTKKPKGWERTANVTYRLTSEPFTVQPDGSWKQSFTLYTGPKNPPVLAAYRLDEWVYYGWFGGIAKFLSWVLHFFHDRLVGNYAIAIIMLTVVVRGCMFPISRKAAKNAAMMQELAPEMRKIAEKYKNNMEARGKAQQELFRKHNYNPLSGCWMMFLQLPVFMGLYRALAVDIELRQAPLIPGVEWASNLAGPDKLFYWKTDLFSYFTDESGWLGPYFNLLPIFTIALFLVQQKMFTPPATDEQTRMQMKMMKIMTVVMGVLFYKVPAGLCVYFITSSLWGIAERKLIPKPQPPKLTDPVPEKPVTEKSDKPFSFLGSLAPKSETNGDSIREMRRKRSKRK